MPTTVTTTLTAVSCYSCGITFGMPKSYYDDRRNDHEFWYCPNGHRQHFIGKSDADLERERADALARRLESAQARNTHLVDQRDAAERSAAAFKGVATKLRKRVAAGVCPAGCRRNFADLHRHMQTQHPNFTQDKE